MGFIIKKIISAFLLPPGCLILLLIAFAAFQLRRRRTVTAAAFMFPALLLWAMSSSFVSTPLMASLERGLTIPAHPKGDVIILLGGGLHDGVPDLSGRGAPPDNMQARMVTAVRLHRMLNLPVLVSGGAVFEGRTPEATVVRRFLLDLGMPPGKILVEDKSRDTIDNALFCKKILIQEGFKKPILVTAAFHMRRSIEAFCKADIEVLPVPSSFLTPRGRSSIWIEWLPNAGALATTATAIHEYLGMLFYALIGKGSV
jgi:uncharacterized SAM-binding protein YcdF (DUF218 family)